MDAPGTVAATADQLDAQATALYDAYATRLPVPPPTEALPDLDVAGAYGIQTRQVDRWLSEGRRLAGFKVGLTSKAMQRQLGVDRPDFGHLFADMVLDAGVPVPARRFIAPRVEPEISFVLRAELAGPGLTVVDVLRAVDYAIASVELIDSRVADWRISLPDTIADNASSGALVLGSRPVKVDAVDLAGIGCVMTRNGEVTSTGAGAAVLGHPLHALLFLANQLGALGRTLPAGSIVMAGALTAAVPVSPGDIVGVRFAHLGELTIPFAEEDPA